MNRTRKLFSMVALAAIVATGCEYVEVDGVGSRTYDPDLPPQSDVVDFAGCTQGDAGQWQPSGTVVNQTDERATYAVTIAFMQGDTRLQERTTWLRDLGPGETASLNRAWWVHNADLVTGCELLTVDRFTTPIAQPADS